MAPPWFDTENYWAVHGSTVLGTKQGSLNSFAELQEAYIEVPCNVHDGAQYVGAAAIFGESTPPMEHFGPRSPSVWIAGGYYLEGYYFRNGFQRGLALTDDFWGTNQGTVNLITYPPDVPEEVSMPPYPPEMQTIRMGMSIPGGGVWTDGRPMWIGEYYMELMLYSRETDPASIGTPGFGGDGSEDSTPVTCPPRPPWPYREPVAMVDGGGPARIRRSRP